MNKDKSIVIFDIGNPLGQSVSVYGATLDEAYQAVQEALKRLTPPKPVSPHQKIDNAYLGAWDNFKISQEAVDSICATVGSAIASQKPVPSKEMTDWFPPEVKPMRDGVYQVRIGDYSCFSHWNKQWWGFHEPTQKAALACRESESADQQKSWRGFKEPQE